MDLNAYLKSSLCCVSINIYLYIPRMSRESKPAPSMVSPYRMNHTILSTLWFGSGLDSPPPIVLYTRASLSEIRFSFSFFSYFLIF